MVLIGSPDGANPQVTQDEAMTLALREMPYAKGYPATAWLASLTDGGRESIPRSALEDPSAGVRVDVNRLVWDVTFSGVPDCGSGGGGGGDGGGTGFGCGPSTEDVLIDATDGSFIAEVSQGRDGP